MLNDINISKEELKELYYKDFPLWAEINLEFLKQKQYDMVDWENVIEEFDYIAKSDLRDCINHLAVILEHLYKLDNFKDLAGGETVENKWKRDIMNARTEIKFLFKRYKSLKTKLPNELQSAWDEAIKKLEIWLRDNDYNPDNFTFPEKCPYTYEEAMTRDLERNK